MPYEKKSSYKYGSGFKVQGSRFKKSEQKPAYKPKRGTLAPLVKEEEKEKAGIHELSYDFGCRITRLFQYLTEDAEYKEYVQSTDIQMWHLNRCECEGK